MEKSIPLLIGVLTILILLSAYFSATETAFSTANRIKLIHLANKGNKKAQKVLDVLENYSSFISGILIGNNIVNIVATTIATVIFTSLFTHNGATISSIVMTVIILLFGEITPKTIASFYPESFAMFSVSIVKVAFFILKPLLFIFSLWEKFLKLFIKDRESSSITGEELITMIEEVERDGSINEKEGELIISAIEFNDAEVQDILTPRVDIIAVDKDWDIDQIEETFLDNNYSRLPVYEGTVDNIIGFLHERDLHKLAKRKNGSVESIIQAPLRVTESMKIYELLRIIQLNNSHLAIVIDEYGGTAGIVTLEDILEELVGDIYDEHDIIIEEFEQVSDNCFIIDGGADIEEAFELFNVDINEEDYDANTLSGWISEHTSKIPTPGETIEFRNLLIEILEADDKKVQKVKISSQKE